MAGDKFAGLDAEGTSTAIEKIDLILDALASNGPMRLAEVCEVTGLPRATTHRLLMRMVRLRWASRLGMRYELGVRLFEMGSEAVRNHWFHTLALPHLDELQKKTGQVVHLAFLDGADVIYWEKLWGSFGAQIPTRIGGRWPAHRTALGKALLSVEDDCYLDQEIFDTLRSDTSRSIGSRPQLRSAIGQVRRNGYSVDRGESITGVGCIAIPVTARPGRTTAGIKTTAAISLCGLESHVCDNKRLVSILREVVTGIERAAVRSPYALDD